MLLKVDIDGHDCLVTEAILEAKFSPALVLMEINARFPPPLKFSLIFEESYESEDRTFLYGCSLSYASEMMCKRGYRLVQLTYIDALFIRDDIAEVHGISINSCGREDDVWTHGYWNAHNRDYCFPWNRNLQHWNEPPGLSDTSKLQRVLQSIMDDKKIRENIPPFVLYL